MATDLTGMCSLGRIPLHAPAAMMTDRDVVLFGGNAPILLRNAPRRENAMKRTARYQQPSCHVQEAQGEYKRATQLEVRG